MRAAGLAGISRRRDIRTTRRDPDGRRAPDLVERNFSADRLWVADITHVPTLAGFLFLTVVLDAFSRRVVGWSMADRATSNDSPRPVSPGGSRVRRRSAAAALPPRGVVAAAIGGLDVVEMAAATCCVALRGRKGFSTRSRSPRACAALPSPPR
jgi:hypothetical protein